MRMLRARLTTLADEEAAASATAARRSQVRTVSAPTTSPRIASPTIASGSRRTIWTSCWGATCSRCWTRSTRPTSPTGSAVPAPAPPRDGHLGSGPVGAGATRQRSRGAHPGRPCAGRGSVPPGALTGTRRCSDGDAGRAGLPPGRGGAPPAPHRGGPLPHRDGRGGPGRLRAAARDRVDGGLVPRPRPCRRPGGGTVLRVRRGEPGDGRRVAGAGTVGGRAVARRRRLPAAQPLGLRCRRRRGRHGRRAAAPRRHGRPRRGEPGCSPTRRLGCSVREASSPRSTPRCSTRRSSSSSAGTGRSTRCAIIAISTSAGAT